MNMFETKKYDVLIKNTKRLYPKSHDSKRFLLEVFGLDNEMELMYVLVNSTDDISFIPEMIRNGENWDEKELFVDNGESKMFKYTPISLPMKWRFTGKDILKSRYEHWFGDRLISLEYVYTKGSTMKEIDYSIKFI